MEVEVGLLRGDVGALLALVLAELSVPRPEVLGHDHLGGRAVLALRALEALRPRRHLLLGNPVRWVLERHVRAHVGFSCSPVKELWIVYVTDYL